MAVAYRLTANRQLRAGLSEDGTPLFFNRGDEIPAERYANENALRAAINMRHITATPVFEPDPAPRGRSKE